MDNNIEQSIQESMRRLSYWRGQEEAVRARYAAAMQPYKDAIEKIAAGMAGELRRAQSHIQFHEQNIMACAPAVITPESKRKTFDTPFGAIAGRTNPAKFNYTDEEALLTFVKASFPDMVRIVESIDKAALKKAVTIQDDVAVTEDGEVVPGINITPALMSYSIKPLVLQVVPDAEQIEAEEIAEEDPAAGDGASGDPDAKTEEGVAA